MMMGQVEASSFTDNFFEQNFDFLTAGISFGWTQ
jgi:hypothetical protein